MQILRVIRFVLSYNRGRLTFDNPSLLLVYLLSSNDRQKSHSLHISLTVVNFVNFSLYHPKYEFPSTDSYIETTRVLSNKMSVLVVAHFQVSFLLSDLKSLLVSNQRPIHVKLLPFHIYR